MWKVHPNITSIALLNEKPSQYMTYLNSHSNHKSHKKTQNPQTKNDKNL